MELPNGAGVISAYPGSALTSGTSATVVLRYERVDLREPGEPASSLDNQVKASVQELTYMGGFLRVRAQTDTGLSLVADAAASESARRWTVGTQVIASWATADARALGD
jgi:ABC-type Fe3+/spermidine/putrescine transport system ATPase subunit